MKFKKVIFKNFKPYHDEVEIDLFDQDRKKFPISINVGPNAHGKTSISEGIMWCLYGENFSGGTNWDTEWVNDVAINMGKEKGNDEVNMMVELQVEIEGEQYRLIRNGIYDIQKEEKKRKPALKILQDGEPIEQSPVGFINDHFLPVDLMKYYIFDADDMLTLFEQDRKKTIKRTIDRIVGIKDIDNLSETLAKLPQYYENQITEIESKIPGDMTDKLKQRRKEKKRKENAIQDLKEEIDELKDEKNNLFKGDESSRAKQFTKLTEERNELQDKLQDLNEEFLEDQIEGEQLISLMDLFFLNDIINRFENEYEEKAISHGEFESLVNELSSTLNNQFEGIIIDENKPKLIKKLNNKNKIELKDINALNFEEEESTIERSIKNEIRRASPRSEEVCDQFEYYKDKIKSLTRELEGVENDIKNMGETEENRELKRKFKRFQEIEQEIEEKRERISDIERMRDKIASKIEDIENKMDITADRQVEIDKLERKKERANYFKEIIEEAKKEFLDDFLTEVNREASEFLRNTVREEERKRFHSIKVDPNYNFHIKKENGEELSEGKINRVTIQIGLMSFFISMSQYIGKDIPYVIDGMLIRSDPGHDKRMIGQVGEKGEQLIMHMIPGKEYNEATFDWLSSYLNIQNYIYREDVGASEPISYVEKKAPDRVIEFSF